MAALLSTISSRPSRPLAAAFVHSSSSSSSSSIISTSSSPALVPCASCRLDSSLSASVSPSCFFSRSVSSSSSSWRRLPSGLLGQPLQLRVNFPVLRFKPALMAGTASAAVAEKSIHDFSVKDIDGKDVPLSTYKGKVLLIVNVASRCGLTTSNYTELAQLYSKFKGQDFEILAFPCNQFGGQEPGSNEQIKEFACSRFKAEYPIFDKIDVNGANTAPVYKFLKSSKSTGLLGTLLGDNVKWNFEKFLVDKDGQVVQRYEPTTSPLQIENDIRKLLQA